MKRGGPLKRKTKLRARKGFAVIGKHGMPVAYVSSDPLPPPQHRSIQYVHKPLKRSSKPLPKLGRRGKEAKAALAKSRPVVLARAGGQCEWCGRRAELDVHHLLRRGRNPGHALLHAPESLVALCRRCHDGEHS